MLFRDLTDTERETIYVQGLCPFCGNEEFFEGAHGGRAIEWYCTNPRCLAGFTLTPPSMRISQLIRDSLITIVEGKATLTGPRIPEPELERTFKRRTTLRAWLDMLHSTRWGNHG